LTDWAARVAQAGPAPLAGELRRLVESQEEVATSRLVSSLARQAVLEDLLETTKPPGATAACITCWPRLSAIRR